MSKHISFTKYKEYLQSQGYSLEDKTTEYGAPVNLRDYVFSKEDNKNIYKVTVHTEPYDDHITSINYGHGSPYSGCWKRINIDYRKNFWKELTIDE